MRIPPVYLKEPERLFERDKKRFLARVVVTPEGCWEWQGAMMNGGYGILHLMGRRLLAHRVSYLLFKDDLDDAKHIDHLCCNKRCVNPDHLELVVPAENTRRWHAQRGPSGIAAENKVKSHCPHGHEYTPENTYIGKSGSRFCRTCGNLSVAAAYRKKKEANPGPGRGSQWSSKTHCPKGHEYSGGNLRIRGDGARVCITCRREQGRLQEARRRERRKQQE